MAVIGVKSITGITSITNAAGGADVLTFHSNNTTERLRITSNGYIGINQTNPQRYLHITGNDGATGATLGNSDTQLVIDNAGTNGGHIEFLSANNGGGHLMFTDTDAVNRGRLSYHHNSDYFRFDTAGTERFSIYSSTSGNGGIAKFTTPTSGDMLNLQNSSASGQGLIFGVDTSASPGYTYWKNNTTASYGAAFIVGGSERLRITSGGNVDINGTPPWSVAGGDYRNLSISGQVANSGGFLWLGNGTATTNGDFDLGRINFCNGATITSQITGTTQTSANDDGRLCFYTKATGGSLTEKLRITSGGNVNIGSDIANTNSLLNVDSGSSTDGHLIATFNGQESSNHAGLNIAHYLCGSDDNRTGLYWEHQNVSNERMWMGDDKRLYLKNSNPTESTAQGRYLMTVEGGTADFPDGSTYDNAAKSALEIKKHYPNAQTGNYWIFDYNNVPRHIRCDMEIDGGGWMLWNDYNTTSTSMNEALGGSSTSPHSGLGRGNYDNYKYYQVLIRASKINDGDREVLHTIVQLDHNGNLFRKYDYGEEFFLEEVGDPFNPAISQYFTAGTGEFIKMDGAYQPQLGASGWQTFSGGGWQQVFVREVDSRLAPGDHRSYAMHERIYCFNDNGVPMWRNSTSMGVLPYWTDIRGGAAADGAGLNSSGTQTDNMQDTGRTMYSNNGNNGDFLHGRIHGVFLGEFEVAFRLSGWWGWAVGNMGAGIGVAESIRDGQAWPYYQNTNYGYAAFGLMNNSSNNLWYPNHFYNGDTSQTIGNSGSGYTGHNTGWNIMWRTSDGTIKIRRQDNVHGTYTYGKFVGPLVFGNGTQSPMFTEMGVMWDNPWNTNGSCMR